MWGVRCWCWCFGSGFSCAPPLLVGVLAVCFFGACCACTPPLLAPQCGVGVSVWDRALAAPRLSWLGCWGVCVFVCAFHLYPATRGWGVLCGCVCLGLGSRLRRSTPSWDVVVCVCLCACSACTPPLLTGVCGVDVCAWSWALAAPRYSWLGCWGVCVFACVLCLYPATPGWGVRCGCACLGSGFGCAPPLLAGVLGCVCVLMCALCFYSSTPG